MTRLEQKLAASTAILDQGDAKLRDAMLLLGPEGMLKVFEMMADAIRTGNAEAIPAPAMQFLMHAANLHLTRMAGAIALDQEFKRE